MSGLTSPEIGSSAMPPTIGALSFPADGIVRDEALRDWHRRMLAPMPSAKELRGELTGWSGAVGRQGWAASQYGATSALLLRSPSVRSSHSADWIGVHRACSEAIEPLSRYTAGWSDNLHAIRVTGLPDDVGLALREAARGTGRRLRRFLCGPPSVIESPSTIQEFRARPHERRDVDIDEAVRLYGIEVRRLADALASQADASARDIAAATRLREHLGALLDQFDVDLPDPPTPESISAARAEAKNFLDPIAEDYVRRHAHLDATAPQQEYFADGYQRVLTTYTRRVLRGLELAGTEHYLPLRVAAARKDDWRKRSRETVSASAGAGAEADTVHPDTGLSDRDVSSTISRLRAAAATIIERDPTLRRSAGAPSWEARTATEILCEHLSTDLTDPAQLRLAVAARWEAHEPPDSTSTNSAAAAQHVVLLIVTALNRAAQDDRGAA